MFKKSQALAKKYTPANATTYSTSKNRLPSLIPANETNGNLLNKSSNVLSRTLLIIFPTLEGFIHFFVKLFSEFVLERELLCTTVLPELQQYCSERNVELECCTFFESKDFIQNVDEFFILNSLLAQEQTIALVYNYKYGEMMLPLELRINEFEEILSLALETSNEAQLLKEFYTLDKDRTENNYDVYRLKPTSATRDPASAKRLCKSLQKCLKKAYQEGTLQQINVERYEQLFKSFIELILEKLLTNSTRHLFFSRRFLGYQAQASNDPWMDSSSANYQKISQLKNKISEQFKENETFNYLPIITNVHNTTPTQWLETKEAIQYGIDIGSKV